MIPKQKRLNRKEARAIQLESQNALPKSHLRSILEVDNTLAKQGTSAEERLACMRSSLDLLSQKRIRFEGDFKGRFDMLTETYYKK